MPAPVWAAHKPSHVAPAASRAAGGPDRRRRKAIARRANRPQDTSGPRASAVPRSVSMVRKTRQRARRRSCRPGVRGRRACECPRREPTALAGDAVDWLRAKSSAGVASASGAAPHSPGESRQVPGPSAPTSGVILHMHPRRGTGTVRCSSSVRRSSEGRSSGSPGLPPWSRRNVRVAAAAPGNDDAPACTG
jgi:hypothetical protein